MYIKTHVYFIYWEIKKNHNKEIKVSSLLLLYRHVYDTKVIVDSSRGLRGLEPDVFEFSAQLQIYYKLQNSLHLFLV
jgi:hypothetical protein